MNWLNRTVLGIGFASLLSDVGHEMATTALPAFLTTLGATSALLGLVEGVADGLSSFAKLFSELYSDRLRRRKPLAVVGYFITASGMASFALATAWWHDVRGVGFGVLATVNGIGDFLSSALVGHFWVISPVAAMAFVIVASLIGSAVIASTHRTTRSSKGSLPSGHGVGKA